MTSRNLRRYFPVCFYLLISFFFGSFVACTDGDNGSTTKKQTYNDGTDNDDSSHSLSYIADHTIAKESVLRSIPESAINNAKNNLHIAYFHSSHGSRVITGMTGLTSYKPGDSELYAFTVNGVPQANKLDIDDDNAGSNDLSAKEGIIDGHPQWFNETVA